MTIQLINPADLPPQATYTQVVVAAGGRPWTLRAGTGMKKTGELAGAGQRARGVTVQVGDRGGALLPRSATSPAREPPA